MTDIIINEGSDALSPTAASVPGGYGLLTFADSIDHLIEWGYRHGGDSPQPLLRECVQAAYLDILNATDWPSLRGLGRIPLQLPQTTGTISYDATTRIVTLAGATWPSWAPNATLRIGLTDCRVDKVLSATQLTLDAALNPGFSVAAGTPYSLYCQWYSIPNDFKALCGFMDQQLWDLASECSMVEIMRLYKLSYCTGYIRFFAIGERPNQPGERALWVYPAPQTARPGDFIYERRPREMLYTGKDAVDRQGTLSVTAGSFEVVGVGTAWEAGMQGAMLRMGDTTNYPTGRAGLHRYKEQKRIYSVTDATHLTLASAADATRSSVKYCVTDPVEIEPCAATAFRRYCEMHLAIEKGLDKPEQYVALAEKALVEAMAGAYPVRNDSANGARRSRGEPTNYTVTI